MTAPPLDRTTGPKLAFIPPRVEEFQQTLQADETYASYQQYDVQRTIRPTTKT